jgi:hypothetical protein
MYSVFSRVSDNHDLATRVAFLFMTLRLMRIESLSPNFNADSIIDYVHIFVVHGFIRPEEHAQAAASLIRDLSPGLGLKSQYHRKVSFPLLGTFEV